MNTMTYRGYTARIDYSDADGCFVGHIPASRTLWDFTVNPLQNCEPRLQKR